MCLDRIDRQEKRLRDLLIRHVRWQEPQHRQFAVRQRAAWLRRPWPLLPPVEPVKDPRGKRRAPAGRRDQHGQGRPRGGACRDKQPARIVGLGQRERLLQQGGRVSALAEAAMRNHRG
jgi:hypothetical protein